ncbi:hypothetical protein [Mesorhizobium amorphae]|uniref:hypothetical protein n=1 Tax=Mesorhizobium amorphae TaxID=71433 RepID=UPI001786D3A0|nr:hypothetical protein [Mesorhizobium amorphae]
MANIRSPSCECTTAFVSIFDGRKFVKGAHCARITKVGQTNIDKLLVDFFCRHVKFLVLATTAETPHGCRARHDEAPFPVASGMQKPPRARLKKKSQRAGTILAPAHFDTVSNS